MNKFKVGDRVKLIEVPELRNRTWYKNNFGKTMTVKRATGWSVDVVENPFSWNEVWLTAFAPDRHELHITSDGTTTNAVYKLNGKVEKTAKAVCCPSDTFNFNIGAELAINRVLYGTDYNPREVAFKEPVQNEPKETVTLYCVKDYTSLLGSHWLTKGKTYEFNGYGVTFDDGFCSSGKKTFDGWSRRNPTISACLIRAEKRPAKLNEYVVITQDGGWHYKSYKKGDIYQVARISPINSDRCYCAYNKTDEIFLDVVEYIVLPDYIPEKVEPTYYSGKVICTAWSGDFYTVGKVYEVVNGYMTNNNGSKSVLLQSFDEVSNYCHGKFIEYRGEQS